jgi:type I restriction enzyme S subunit
MISSIDEMVKSQFIEKIGDTRTNPKGWDVYTLKELVVPSCPISYGIVQPGDDIEEGGVPIVRPVDLDETHRVTAKGLKRTTKEISDAYKRTILEGNELLLCVRGTTGLVGLATDELKGCNVTRGITPLSFNEKADRVFMLCTFLSDGIQEFISDNTIGSALRGINMAVIREMKIPTPPVHVQKSFADLYIQADKSKFELKQAIEKIDKVMRALMQ